jgi:hypothetical protein
VLTLRNTFKYQGDVKQSPFPKLTIAARFPVFDYVRAQTDDVSVVRKVAAFDRAETEVDLHQAGYRISAPTEDLVGTQVETLGNFLAYTTASIANKNLRDLSLTIHTQFSAGSSDVGNITLQAVYVIKNFARIVDAVRSVAMAKYTRHPDPTATKSFLDKSVFLINKQEYDNTIIEFKRLVGRNDDWLLLSIIQRFVEDADIDPGSEVEFGNASSAIIAKILQENEVQNREEAVRFIAKHLRALFDFPILVPAIKSVTVAGVFQVNTPDTSVIGLKDLGFYDLALEYTERGIADTPSPRVVHFDWKSKDVHINQNKTPFSFSKAAPIIPSNVVGAIIVSVKAFDGTLLFTKEYDPNDPSLKEVQIVVSLVRPVTLTKGAVSSRGEVGKRLRGQVLELTKKCPLDKVTVVIQARQDGDELWRVVAAANADASGNFSMHYPFGKYAQAQAVVSLTPDSPADIPIKDIGPNATIADDFLYLLVKDAACRGEDKAEDCDCGCSSPKQPSRLPDQTDLISSDEYTQDIGGSCVNLSTPNRTLNEFHFTGIVRTSDPDVTNYKLTRTLMPTTPNTPIDEANYSFELTSDHKKIKRAPVDIDNPIRWQDAPGFGDNLTFYQAVSVATGHVLHYKTVVKADGYSLGNLLYSLALAPGQKKQIVVIDSAHTLQGAESQNITQSESLAASLLNERNITDQVFGGLSEAMQGKSSSDTGGISAGLGVAANIGVVSGALGVAGGYSSSNASASQNSSKDTSMFFGEKLRQTIMQNAESYRQLSATVVTSVKEGQQYAVTTDVVANHNHCHALTMMYFEVLRHFAVFQELANVEECIFVPLLMTKFSRENLYKWADVLARNLLPLSANTYLGQSDWSRTHPLIKGFDANERKLTNYAHVDFPPGKFCDEAIASISGSLTLRVNLPRPKTRFDRILSLPVIRKTVTTQGGVDVAGTIKENIKDSVVGALTGGLSVLFGGGPSIKTAQDTHEVLTAGKIFDRFMILDENYESVPPAQCIRVFNFRPVPLEDGTSIDFFGSNTDDKELWKAYAAILKMDLYVFLDMFVSNVIADWDKIFFKNFAPRMIDSVMADVNISLKPFAGLNLSRMNNYTGGVQVLQYNLRAGTSLTRAAIEHVFLSHLFAAGYGSRFTNETTFIVESLIINYSTRHYRGQIYSGVVGADLLDPKLVDIFTPMNADEQRDPRTEDTYLVTKLIDHLNSNVEHYNKALWLNLDPDRRYMLLDGFNIQVYDDFGAPLPGSRSLSSVVKNELLTITGNSLVFPVAAGYRVSRSYILETNRSGEAEEVSLFEHYKPYTPVPPYRISVPAKGVFLEAVQGACDACERVKENSSQDWKQFQTDEPTSILPVTTPVPTITDWKAAFKDFASPLINIQNAPALPTPAAGLAGVTELLGKAGVFKDITGLDATQQNVIRTYLSNQENAKAFAEMAKSMAMQEHNTQHSDKIMESLNSAKAGGAINQDEYGKLVKDHIQKQIDGGEAQQAANTANNSDLGKAAANAVNQGREVQAVQNHPDGTQTSVVQKKSTAPESGTGGEVSPTLSVFLQRPDPNKPAEWINLSVGEGPGFAQFDRSFDATDKLLPDYPDQDSGRFRISIVDADPFATGTREVKWQTTFDEAGSNPVDAIADSTITLTSDLSTPSVFVSKPLVIVHEKDDLPPTLSNGLGGTSQPGRKNYRARLGGMFTKIVIEDAGRKRVFPTISTGRTKGIPIQVFLLKQGSVLSIPHSEVGERLAEIQQVYEPHGLFLNAHKYLFTAAQTAKFKPVEFKVGTAVPYLCNELDMAGTGLNPSLLSEDDLVKLGTELEPNKGGPAIRIFFFGDFAVNHPPPKGKGPRIAMAMNRSYVRGMTISAGAKQKLMFSLMCAGRANSKIHPYVVAHELGHLLMDKRLFLEDNKKTIPANEDFLYHFNPPAKPGYPLNQNLMRPLATDASGLGEPKRIWDVEDADSYNQFKDLLNNVSNLQI